MWNYEKRLQYPISISTPNAKMASFIISQYGGPDGEMGASMRYLAQRFSFANPRIAGVLTDIGTEELAHLEMIGAIVRQLTRGLSAKELDFLRRTDPILYAHALRVQRMAEALKQQLSHAKSKQEANDMITSAIAGVSDKDPDKEYLLAAYNEVSKNFHKSPAYQRLPNTPEDAKKRKTNNPNAHFSDDEDTNDDTDDLLSWTPLQEIIDAAPTLECQG